MNNFVDLLKQAREENAPYKLFKAVYKDAPKFDQFLDYAVRSKDLGNFRSDREGFYILNSTELEYIPDFINAKDFYNAVKEAYGEKLGQHSLSVIISEHYRNISDVSGVKKHFDPIDTVHWNCVGATIWKIWNSEDNAIEVLMEPGDVIYVAEGNVHEVESLTPRAGIIFTAGEGYKAE